MMFNVIPITDFCKQAKEILASLKDTPIVLAQRGRPTAVLLDYEAYNKREEEIEQLELMLDDLVLAHTIETSAEEEFISIEELLVEQSRPLEQSKPM